MSPGIVLLVLLSVVLAGGLGIVGFRNDWRLPASSSSHGLSSDRFLGAEGVTLVPGPVPDYWWSRLVTDTAVVEPSYLPGTPSDMRFKRVLIPTDLLFAPDSTTLEGGSTRAIDLIVGQISDSSLQVVVVCHSSSDGPPASRQPLSLRRADSLADALERKLGRPGKSVMRIGKGDTVKLPNVSPDTPTGRVLHRRCEVFVEVR